MAAGRLDDAKGGLVTRIATASELFAVAHGRPIGGPHRCVFCGGPADESATAKEFLRDTFTARDTLAAASSPWVCTGCSLSMTTSAGQSPEGKPWMWAWLITELEAKRFALCMMLGGERIKADKPRLLAALLTPPEPAVCPSCGH